MGKRYERITYSDHAEEQIAFRDYLTKALVEEALNAATPEPARGEALQVCYPIPGRDRLVVLVIYFEATAKSAYVVTVYPVQKGRLK